MVTRFNGILAGLMIAALATLTLNTQAATAPNLQATNTTVTGTATSGSTIVVQYGVENIGGTATTAATITDRIWLHTSATWDPSATLLYTYTAAQSAIGASGGSYTNSGVTVTLPGAIFGTYYIIVQNDVFDTVGRTNWTDNWNASSAFTVSAQRLSGDGYPDSTSDNPGQVHWRNAWSLYTQATNNGYTGTSALPLFTDSEGRLKIREAYARNWLATNNNTYRVRGTAVTITNTTMTDVTLPNGSVFLFTGATAFANTNTTFTGFAGGTDGRVVTLITKSGQTNSFANNSGTATAANRIYTGTGGTISFTNSSAVSFIYDGTQSRWIRTASAP